MKPEIIEAKPVKKQEFKFYETPHKNPTLWTREQLIRIVQLATLGLVFLLIAITYVVNLFR